MAEQEPLCKLFCAKISVSNYFSEARILKENFVEVKTKQKNAAKTKTFSRRKFL